MPNILKDEYELTIEKDAILKEIAILSCLTGKIEKHEIIMLCL